MEKHLDIMENSNVNSKTAKNFFVPTPFAPQMYDPYNTGPVTQIQVSPAGGVIYPRRNPYFVKPMNRMTNPYSQNRRFCPYKMSRRPFVPRMSSPILSPAGGIIAPRSNTYYTKPIFNPYHQCGPGCYGPSNNPFSPTPVNTLLNPYMTQYRDSMGSLAPYVMRNEFGDLRPKSMGDSAVMPMGPPPMGPPPMGPPPMGPPPMGPPPMGPMMGPRPF